jgi:hypothetical protein
MKKTVIIVSALIIAVLLFFGFKNVIDSFSHKEPTINTTDGKHWKIGK